MRSVYRNVGETNGLIGLYPYAPLHDMRRALQTLDPRKTPSPDADARNLVRDAILQSFYALRETFLEELDLEEPDHPLLISSGRRAKKSGSTGERASRPGPPARPPGPRDLHLIRASTSCSPSSTPRRTPPPNRGANPPATPHRPRTAAPARKLRQASAMTQRKLARECGNADGLAPAQQMSARKEPARMRRAADWPSCREACFQHDDKSRSSTCGNADGLPLAIRECQLQERSGASCRRTVHLYGA